MLRYTKSSALVVLFTVLALCPVAAHALEQKTHMFSISPTLEYYNFDNKNQITASRATRIKENGLLYGLNANYTYRGKLYYENLSKGMLKVDGQIIVGRLDLDGVLYDNAQYKISEVKNFLGEIRGLAGYDFQIFSDTTITPFTGLGYRFFSDNSSKVNAGYRRVSNYIYSPIGFETSTPLSDGWSAGLTAEYDIFWHGWQATDLSDLDSLLSDLTNDQTKGFGLRGSIKVVKAMEDKNYIIQPYVNYWNVGESDTQKVYFNGVHSGVTFQEPKSSTTEIGIKAGVEF